MSVLQPAAQPLDVDSNEWPGSLRAAGQTGEEAVARLHALILRAARFEVARRQPSLPDVSGDALDDIAHEAADDALVKVLWRLDDFRGNSRFSTWVYKFAVLETAVKLRKCAWQARELRAGVDLEPNADVEQRDLLSAVQTAMSKALTPHERQVLVALALNGMPIDVLAERLGTTRGALYKTLQDARRTLRAQLDERALTIA